MFGQKPAITTESLATTVAVEIWAEQFDPFATPVNHPLFSSAYVKAEVIALRKFALDLACYVAAPKGVAERSNLNATFYQAHDLLRTDFTPPYFSSLAPSRAAWVSHVREGLLHYLQSERGLILSINQRKAVAEYAPTMEELAARSDDYGNAVPTGGSTALVDVFMNHIGKRADSGFQKELTDMFNGDLKLFGNFWRVFRIRAPKGY